MRASTWAHVLGPLVLGLLLSGCSMLRLSPEAERAPREIRTDGAAMAIERVEREVAREEVAEAVALMVQQAPVCFAWPSLWLEGARRGRVFVVRFDLMARDWGAEVAELAVRRMNGIVDLGFLTRRARADLGEGAAEFRLTAEGRGALSGSLDGDATASFCAPGNRRLVDLVAMEWGQFACGSLRVHFTHGADDWPNWAATESARARVAEIAGGPGAVREGVVSLSRQWFPPSQTPATMRRNGELRSLCYDAARDRVTGDDLDLNAAKE